MKTLQGLGIADYLRILRRRFIYAIIASSLVAAGATYYVWSLPPRYKSETTIMLGSRLLPEEYVGSIIQDSVAERLDFVKNQLRSRAFIERIVQEFRVSGPQQGVNGSINIVLSAIEVTSVSPTTFKVAYTAGDPGRAQAITRRLAERVLALNESLRKDKVNAADQFLDEQLRQSTDDLTAAEAAVRQFYRQYFPSIPDDQQVNLESLTTLDRQIANVTNELENSTNRRNGLLRRIEERRQLQLIMESAPPPVRALNPSPEPAVSDPQPVGTEWDKTLATKRAELQAAASRYTPEHPDVRRLRREVAQLESQIAAAHGNTSKQGTPAPVTETANNAITPPSTTATGSEVRTDLLQAEMQLEMEQLNREIAKQQQTKNELTATAAVYRKRLNLPPDLAQQLEALTRAVNAARQRYSTFANKKLSTEIAGSVDASESNALFKIIDPANLPRGPVWPDRQTFYAIGYLLALASGIGAAFIREFIDSSFVDEDEVYAQLKLPILASIPYVDGKGSVIPRTESKRILALASAKAGPGNASATFSLHHADSKIARIVFDTMTMPAEQYRLARASLSLMQKQHGLRTLLVCSAVPNEGKSFVAACLAGVLAQETDKSVLLVHGDMRTTSGSELMGVGQRQNLSGLSELLEGKVELDDALLKCAEMNLWLLPSGHSVKNPADLLCLPEFEKVMRELSQRFDWVIIDSPPVLALADASLLLPACDTALMVVRAQKTPAGLVKDVVQKVGKEHICGVMLNFARHIKSSPYYKNYYRQAVSMKK